MRRTTVLVLMLAALAACADDNGTAGPGSDVTRVLLTDAPFPFDLVASVDVHIVRIDAATTFDTTTAVDWTPLVTPDRQFNLLELQNGETALLGEVDVEATDYAAIRMVIRTDLSAITLTDGSLATVNWMGPATQTIHAAIEQPLSITDGSAHADLIIDFDAGRSFVVVPVTCDSFTGCPGQASRPAFQFLPWIRAVNEDATGTISGTVRGPIAENDAVVSVPNANITVYRGTNSLMLAATGRADDEGRFQIHYVSGGGPYVVEALPPSGTAGGFGYARNLYVTPGEVTSADVVLGTGGGTGGEGGARLVIAGSNAVDVGESIYLWAFVFNEEGDSVFGTAVTWQVSDPGVARIDGSGSMVQLTGLEPGVTSVMAVSGDLRDSVLVTVGGTGAAVAAVQVSPATATIAVGDSVGFQAVLVDSAGRVLSNRAVTWTVDTSKLSVLGSFGQYLIIRAVATGTTVIRATSEGKEGTATVTVQ
jgi:hypothetical protein